MKICGYEKMAHLYPVGALSQAERKEFEAHVRSCEACGAIAREVESIRGMAVALGKQEALSGLNERIMNGVRRREEKGAPDIRWAFIHRWHRALAPAAVAACFFLLLGVFFNPPKITSVAKSGAATQTATQAEPGKPSEYFMSYGLDADEQKYLGDDSNAALSYHLDNLMGSN